MSSNAIDAILGPFKRILAASWAGNITLGVPSYIFTPTESKVVTISVHNANSYGVTLRCGYGNCISSCYLPNGQASCTGLSWQNYASGLGAYTPGNQFPFNVSAYNTKNLEIAIVTSNTPPGKYVLDVWGTFDNTGTPHGSITINVGSICDSLCTNNSFQDQFDSDINYWVAHAISNWGMPNGVTWNGTWLPAGFLIKGQIKLESNFNQSACTCNGSCKAYWAEYSCPCNCYYGYCGCSGCSGGCCSEQGPMARDVGVGQIDTGTCNFPSPLQSVLGLTPADIATSAYYNIEAMVYLLTGNIKACGSSWWNGLGRYNTGNCGGNWSYSNTVFTNALALLQEHWNTGCCSV